MRARGWIFPAVLVVGLGVGCECGDPEVADAGVDAMPLPAPDASRDTRPSDASADTTRDAFLRPPDAGLDARLDGSGDSGEPDSARDAHLALDAGPPDAGVADGGLDTADGGVDASPPEGPPVEIIEGTPDPDHIIYEDRGAADPEGGIRGLIVFPLRDEAELDARLLRIYDPASEEFRDYLTRDEWMESYAPDAGDVEYVTNWLIDQGFTVPRTASNRLMIEYQGTVGTFNRTFGVELRLLDKTVGYDATVYGPDRAPTLPAGIASRIAGIASTDLLVEERALPGEAGSITSTPPPAAELAFAYSPARMQRAYGVEPLLRAGFHGEGQTIGVIAAATFKFKDVQSFWRGFGITRPDPVVRVVMPPITTRYLETTLDVEWSAAHATAADLIVYEGPDVRDTSMLYVTNEAIGLAEVDVITTSFAHRETSKPAFLRWTYHRASKMAAALGITVVAAAGNSGDTDVPGTSWWVTCVGGTVPSTSSAGDVLSEVVWSRTGRGESLTIPAPPWQIHPSPRRVVNDIALNGARAYWTYWLGAWTRGWTGTSFATPNFASMVAVLNSARAARGEPRLGALNPAFYTDPDVQAAFRDITSGAAGTDLATPGWDVPSGWGAPQLDRLDSALP